jgi:DNA modification methylase
MGRTNDLETGVLYCEDNIDRLARLPTESVDLIYLDPPFFSNRRYEVIWGDEAEVRSFEDRWTGGINYYVGWMRRRVEHMHRILTKSGSIYLHCDPKASHYLKVMMDAIFGIENCRTEIIWKRSSAHSDTKQGRRQHGRIHDTILFYTKGEDWTWNPIYTPYDEEYVRRFYRSVEPETGRRYTLDNLTGPGGASKGNPRYEVMGVTRFWRYTKEKMQDLIRQGRVVQSGPGRVPRYKRYLDEMPGVSLQDLWTDVKPIGARAAERLGYPTQKPEALLERIIESSSDPDDVVLDPFCGCGTTLAVAERMDRRWVGIDISLTAVEIMKARLDRMGVARVPMVNVPESVGQLRKLKPFEFQNWVIRKVDGTHSAKKSGDMGIDGFSFFDHLPVQIKRSDRVGRPVVDNFETAVERYGADGGFIVAFSFTKGAYEEAARVGASRGLNIELVTVEDLLKGRSELVAPLLNRRIYEMPLPKARPRESRPAAERLIGSDQDSGEVA